MHRLNRFINLPFADQWLLVKIVFVMGCVWLGLRLLPFQKVYQLLGKLAHPKRVASVQTGQVEKISDWVGKLGRYFLGEDSCFPQSLTAQLLFSRSGLNPDLRLGVAKGEKGALRAHAWVELDGIIVVGGPVSIVQEYVPLGDLENNDL